MRSVLVYPFINSYVMAQELTVKQFDKKATTYLQEWLLNGKIGETVVVTPTDYTQLVVASAPNRYLEEVEVAPVTKPTPAPVTVKDKTLVK